MIIYINALIQNYGMSLDLHLYDWFTDIEFNPKKSVNCQARSVAIYKLLQTEACFDIINDNDNWREYCISHVKG